MAAPAATLTTAPAAAADCCDEQSDSVTFALTQTGRTENAIYRLYKDLYEQESMCDDAYTSGLGNCGACGDTVIGEDGPQTSYRLLKCAFCEDWLCNTCSHQAKLSVVCLSCNGHDFESKQSDYGRSEEIFPFLGFDQCAPAHDWEVNPLADPAPEERDSKRARKSTEAVGDEKESVPAPPPCALAAQAAAERAADCPDDPASKDEERAWRLEISRSTELHAKKYVVKDTDIFGAVTKASDGTERFPCGCAIRCAVCEAPHVCRYGMACPGCLAAHFKQTMDTPQWKRVKFAGLMHVLEDERLRRTLLR